MPRCFRDLYELMYVAAYGCNSLCRREVEKVLFEHREDTPRPLFFEYLLSQPLPLPGHITANGGDWPEGWERTVYVMAPFAPRLAEHATVVPHVTWSTREGVSTEFSTYKSFREMRLAFRWDQSMHTRSAYLAWAGFCAGSLVQLEVERQAQEVKAGDDESRLCSLPPHWYDICCEGSPDRCLLGLVDHWNLGWHEKVYVEQRKVTADDYSLNSAMALQRLYEPLFVGKKDKNVAGLFIPIASSRLFYGAIWLMFPGHAADPDLLREGVARRIGHLVNRTYLPVLAILHEHWLENLHADALNLSKDEPKVDQTFPSPDDALPPVTWRNVYRSLPGLPGTPRGQRRGVEVADRIESLLKKLWSRRQSGGGLSGPWASREKFKESLVFKSFLLCSPAMITLVDQVIAAADTLSKSDEEALPACLVVGGAGSGKEKLARLIRLISGRDGEGRDKETSRYHAGKEHVVNLAAIRPAPLTAAVMAGIELTGPKEFKFEIAGVLERIRKEAGRKENKSRPAPTLRLDEFNSMDPDSQGVLLRFLDNSEIVPIGGLEDAGKEHTDCLVIGVMNEDPQDISRERVMESLRNGQFLGGLIGDFLYEHFLRIRRLRPDLMYRMTRNGKFVVPPLSSRREDIPLLFNLFVVAELKSIKGKEKYEEQERVHLSLGALDRLMACDLIWPGNVRQLQALAKVVAEYLAREQELANIVTRQVVTRGLEEVGLLTASS